MFKRFFKKSMTEENTNENAAVEPTMPEGQTPGTEVPAGAQVPGVDMTQGAPSNPAPEDAAPAAPAIEVPIEQPITNDETATKVEEPVVDPMKPVGPN